MHLTVKELKRLLEGMREDALVYAGTDSQVYNQDGKEVHGVIEVYDGTVREVSIIVEI